MAKIVFAFGRFNPVTTGHEVLMNKAKAVGGKDYRIYVSKSQDRKKNPLDYKSKIKFMRKIFPAHAKHIVDSPARTAIDVAVDVFNDGYTDLIMIAGSDRVGEFQKLLDKYNGVKENDMVSISLTRSKLSMQGNVTQMQKVHQECLHQR